MILCQKCAHRYVCTIRHCPELFNCRAHGWEPFLPEEGLFEKDDPFLEDLYGCRGKDK